MMMGDRSSRRPGVSTVRQLGRVAAVCGVVAALALIFSVGAFGSSSRPKATVSSGSGLAAAQAVVNASRPPKTFSITTPIKAKIPTGKTVDFIYCGVTICNEFANGVKKAAAVLGWKVNVIPSDGTPQGVLNAWETAVRQKPNVVIGTSYQTSLYAQPLKQLKAMGVGVFNYATSDPGINGNVTARIQSPAGVVITGTKLAAWTTVQTHGKGNVLFLDVPYYKVDNGIKGGFYSGMKSFCPACKVATLNLAPTSLGTTSPSLIVSYLRTHPDVNYVADMLDAATVGLPAALKSAGLSGKVQFVGQDGATENIGYVKAGEQSATLEQGYYEVSAALVDAAARWMTKQSLAPTHAYQTPWWFATKQAPLSEALTNQAIVPNLYKQLAKLWGKS
jgi:ABC-type sugar transport system substrate-binding protein